MNLYQHAQSLYNLFPEHWRSHIILGGGCLRACFDKTPIRDIDCFFRSEGAYRLIRKSALSTSGFVFAKGNARYCEFWRSGGYIINLVGFVFGDEDDHLYRFDFRCCQFVAWYDDEGCLKTDYIVPADKDAREKLLYIQNNNGTERTLRRIRHYVEDYGYSLHPDQTVEQEDAFEGEFGDVFEDGFDAHRPQGVHPSDFREAPPDWLRRARRRVSALPVRTLPYAGG